MGEFSDANGAEEQGPEVSLSEAVEPEPPRPPLDVIADAAGFADAVEKIASGVGPIAIDAERASGFRYSQRAYLIQIFRRGAGSFMFDPPAIDDFAPLQNVIADEEWVLHAASQDLACLREVGLDPSRIFDTELGARIAGLPRVGLGTVVEDLLGIHLAKEHSAADWSTRPLPQSWLLYAVLDVELLVDLRDEVAKLLADAGKLEFAEQEFEATLQREAPVRVDPWRRLSGIHALRSTRALAIAKSLWTARDDYAREIDLAPGRLIPDGSLTAAARLNPATKRELAGLKEFTGRASRSQIDRWWAAIEAGRVTDDLPPLRAPGDAGPPPPRVWADKNPEADARLKAARIAVGEISERLSIPMENLLTPELLRRVAWSPPDPITPESVAAALAEAGARTWQIDQTVQMIAQAFVDAHQNVGDTVDAES